MHLLALCSKPSTKQFEINAKQMDEPSHLNHETKVKTWTRYGVQSTQENQPACRCASHCFVDSQPLLLSFAAM